MESTLQKIRWKDTLEEETVLIGITEIIPQEDDKFFFYVEDMNEILYLMQEDNDQDFVII
jgi:hypothetical protein